MNEGAQLITLYATVRGTPPDHWVGYSLGRDGLVVEDTDYPQALAAARRRFPEGSDALTPAGPGRRHPLTGQGSGERAMLSPESPLVSRDHRGLSLFGVPGTRVRGSSGRPSSVWR